MIKKKYIVSMIAGMVSIQLGTAEENILQFLDKRAEKYAAQIFPQPSLQVMDRGNLS